MNNSVTVQESQIRYSMLGVAALIVWVLAAANGFADISNAQPNSQSGLQSPTKPNTVKAPELVEKTEPRFSQLARDARVEGTVVLSFIIDSEGSPRQIAVVRPLGFGLDEAAVEAVKQWRFSPATRNGKPVNAAGSANVSFRLDNQDPGSNLERQHRLYRSALRQLLGAPAEAKSGAKILKDLADEQFPAAAYSYGRLLEEGKHVPRDETQAFDLYRRAAQANEGNAIARLALPVANGEVQGDREEAIRQLEKASDLGSRDAQFWLGTHYLAGDLLPKDRKQGEWKLRLCAAHRQPQCQYVLGQSILERVGSVAVPTNSPPYLEALAWLRLAEAGGMKDATALLHPHRQVLESVARRQVENLQLMLVHPDPYTTNNSHQ